MEQRYASDAVEALAFSAWLRAGTVPQDLIDLDGGLRAQVELKFNPYHDPENGQSTFGAGGASVYLGRIARGVGQIRPISGGGKDRNGRHIPEQFTPDPYALRTPAEALAHYVAGFGEDRNYYFNKVDTSQVKLTDFPELVKLVNSGDPGLHPVANALGNYNGDLLGKPGNLSSAATVGGLKLRANGVLAIARDGSYQFSGDLSAKDDPYDFNRRRGRSALGEASTTFGRQLPGREFVVHLIGSKPFSARGRR